MKKSGIGLPTQPEIVLPTVPGQASLRLDRLSVDDGRESTGDVPAQRGREAGAKGFAPIFETKVTSEAEKRSDEVPEASVEEARVGKVRAGAAILKETRAEEARERKARVGKDRLRDGVHTALHEVNRMVVCVSECVRAFMCACVRHSVCRTYFTSSMQTQEGNDDDARVEYIRRVIGIEKNRTRFSPQVKVCFLRFSHTHAHTHTHTH